MTEKLMVVSFLIAILGITIATGLVGVWVLGLVFQAIIAIALFLVGIYQGYSS